MIKKGCLADYDLIPGLIALKIPVHDDDNNYKDTHIINTQIQEVIARVKKTQEEQEPEGEAIF